MSRTAGLVLIGLSVAAVVALGVAPNFSSTGADSEKSREVVMFRCNVDAGFEVTAYQGSSASPAKRASDCPEVLAQLLRNGYEIADISHSRVESNFVVYTLWR